MGRSSWIVQMDPQSNPDFIFIRKMPKESWPRQKRRRQHENRGRRWSDVARHQGMPVATSGQKRQGEDSALEPGQGEKVQPCRQALSSVQLRRSGASGLQHCGKINFCHSKLSSSVICYSNPSKMNTISYQESRQIVKALWHNKHIINNSVEDSSKWLRTHYDNKPNDGQVKYLKRSN